MLQSGQKAPDFELPDQQNQPIRLSRYDGKPVVIFFYPKDFTSGCTKEVCEFRDEAEKFDDLHAVVIGISTDPPEKHQEFINRYGLPFKLLSDQSRKIRKLYKVPSVLGWLNWRVTYVLDRDHRIISAFKDMFNAEEHVQVALEALRKK